MNKRDKRRIKRANKLHIYLNWERITDPFILYQAADKSKVNVGWKRSVQSFNVTTWTNVVDLSESLRSLSYKRLKPKTFVLCERGKRRTITAVNYKDRVVQKSLCEQCLIPIIFNSNIAENSATQVGKGTLYARSRFEDHMRGAWARWGNKAYCIHFDFKNYFGSITSEMANEFLRQKLLEVTTNQKEYEDVKKILWLARLYLEDGKTLGLGNQISQVIATSYPNTIDHTLREVVQTKYSGRYMDDGYAFVCDRDTARYAVTLIEQKAKQIGLMLHPDKTYIQPIETQQLFLKNLFSITGSKIVVKPCKTTIRRYKKHYRALLRLAQNDPRLLETLQCSQSSIKSIFMSATDKENYINQINTWCANERKLAGITLPNEVRANNIKA